LAQATLAQTKRPPLQEDIAVAQAALDKAVAELKSKQKAGPDQLASEKTKVDKAKSAVDAAQARFDRAGGNSNPMIGMASVSLDLEKATQDLNAALADYSKFINTNGLEIAQAQAAVAQAEATLALKKRGPAPEEIAVAQVRVQQAQTAVEQAKAGLAKTKLVAPIDGTITGLAMHVGEAVQPGAAVTNIVDLTQLRVETTELDQFGLNRVWMGESVRIIPDAFPDQVLPGHVAYLVPPLPSNSSDIPLNVVTLTFDVQPAGIRSGMTVRVEFLSK
jgi:multidrug resistance efflux pump